MRGFILCLLLLIFHSTQSLAWKSESVDGEVSVEKDGASGKFSQNSDLVPGQALTIGKETTLVLKEGESELTLSPETTIQLESSPDREKKQPGLFKILSGQIHLKTAPNGKSEADSYQFQTPSLLVTTRGQELLIGVEKAGAKEEKVLALEGASRVVVTNPPSEQPTDVASGMGYFKSPGSEGVTRLISPEELRAYHPAKPTGHHR